MKKFFIVIIFFCLFSSFCYGKTQREEYQNDILYSEEYFDYLIEMAQNEKLENDTIKNEPENEQNSDEITFNEPQDVIVAQYEPFRLRIQSDKKIDTYSETFKKVNSKTIIPLSDNFSVIQNMTKSRNKYNSNDYRVSIGSEYNFNKNFNIASGLETNYRGIDQNPTSRKLYFTPSYKFGDKVTLTFHNKLNIQSYSSDHDIALSVSPFKSKSVDFGVYAGITKKQSGACSESINFSTTFYFF